ncbi:MAG: hypothetical protein LBM77_07160 [Spirochaetaceae bacterium]|jgi:arginine/lysine/ornithine decarboxylase|nr:hypothetical protein [Spirochaetaceae bacterium]
MSYKILFFYEEDLNRPSYYNAIQDVMDELEGDDAENYGTLPGTSASLMHPMVIIDANLDDALTTLETDSEVVALAVDSGSCNPENGLKLLQKAKDGYKNFPTFVFREREGHVEMSLPIMELTDEFVWPMEDTAPLIASRMRTAIDRFLSSVIPEMTKMMMDFAKTGEYSWHTPAHEGGAAFRKSIPGRAFYDFYGEPIFRTDLSISAPDLGSLNDHTGAIGNSEKYIAKVFGAERSYTVTNGSSTSNRLLYEASIVDGDIALVDRNCHKSVEQALTLTGSLPVFMIPRRNYLGIIGPIPASEFSEASIKEKIEKSALVKQMHYLPHGKIAQHATITNSTYDGLTYNVPEVLKALEKSVDRIHFDEAWYGYARFNPLYKNRYAMFGNVKDFDKNGPTIIATQSTHKLLAAFSQASYIHIRNGKNPFNHQRFNESFMMNASTSPFYPIIASNEISAAMMDTSGENLTGGSIREAIDFRQAIMRYFREFRDKGDWFFATWQPDKVQDPKKGLVDFCDADPEWLANTPEAWLLKPNEEWHGYGDLGSDYCMLDPIKVSTVSPGVNRNGSMADWGIPATLPYNYMADRWTVDEKTNDFSMLWLFSMGATKGKWGTLASGLLAFKRDYDANTSLEIALPSLMAGNAERYKGYGLHDLADEMFAEMKSLKQLECQAKAFSELPPAATTMRFDYQKLVKGEVEQVPVKDAGGMVVAAGIVPYPPGIPCVMPGEEMVEGSVHQKYLLALEAYDKKFPGFGHDNHGVENINGQYCIYAFKK